MVRLRRAGELAASRAEALGASVCAAGCACVCRAACQLAAPLAWEGAFEQTRVAPAPFTTFGLQSLDLEDEAFALKSTLDEIQAKDYPGVGNDVQKLQNAIDSLEQMAMIAETTLERWGTTYQQLTLVRGDS